MRARPSGLVSSPATAGAGATLAATKRKQPRRAAFMTAKGRFTVCTRGRPKLQGQERQMVQERFVTGFVTSCLKCSGTAPLQ